MTTSWPASATPITLSVAGGTAATPRMMNSTQGMATLLPKALIAGGVRGAGEGRPAVREALEAFTLQRSEAADQLRRSCPRGLMDQVCGVLVLAGTLCGGHITGSKLVCTRCREKTAW